MLARCDKAESAMREAELKAQALMEEVQTLKTEVESLRASQAESSQRAVELDAELQVRAPTLPPERLRRLIADCWMLAMEHNLLLF